MLDFLATDDVIAQVHPHPHPHPHPQIANGSVSLPSPLLSARAALGREVASDADVIAPAAPPRADSS